MNKIGVIIVNWNTGELLASCLASLAALPGAERSFIDEVIVVDNASGDESIAKAKVVVGRTINQPKVRFLQLEENVGFARANNLGIEKLVERNGEMVHVLLLNPDTEVRVGALATMLEGLRSDDRVGIVGPELENPDGTRQGSVRKLPTPAVMAYMMVKLHRLLPEIRLWQKYMQVDFDYSRGQEAEQVMGAAMLVRDDVLTSVGVLDESFFVWFEEVDYCKRVKDAGWKIWYTPDGTVLHHGGASFYQLLGWRRSVPWLKSMMTYALKHFSTVAVGLLLLLVPVALVLMIPATIWHIFKR